MAFATSQTIDQVLTRGLNFRLPNNAPISSLYTIYANGQGQTFWSNSMNPRDLSTVSSAVGELGSTVAIQGSNIYDLYGQVSTLSTSMSSLSNFVIDYTTSTIEGLSTFSTFYNSLNALSNVVKIGLSTLSTTIAATNSTQNTFLTSTILQAANSTTLSTSRGLSDFISRVGLSTVAYPTFYSTTNALARITLSTSGGINGLISSNFKILSTNIHITNSTFAKFLSSFNSTASVLVPVVSTTAGRVSTLEFFTRNFSTNTFNLINSTIASSNAAFQSTITNNVSFVVSSLSSVTGQLSTALNLNISTLDGLGATNVIQNAQISTLARNLSILTTSSILAGVYDTFVQLENYTSTLIGSTIATNQYWQSSLYYSTIIQNQAISQAYFSTFTGYAYLSTVSATTALTEAYASTYATELYSTGSVFILSSLTSTLYGTSFSPTQLRSTNVYIGSNAAAVNQSNFAVAIGNKAGSNTQDLNAIAIGNNAGSFAQGPSAVAIGLNAGATNQLFNAIAIGCNAGTSGQFNNAIAIGALAGSNNQADVTVAVGHQAGQDTQGQGGVAVGWAAGRLTQGQNSVTVGDRSGESNQGIAAVAVGSEAGRTNQGTGAIAIGKYACFTGQGAEAVAVGHFAGYTGQGTGAIGLGFGAGYSGQGNYAIAVGYDAGNVSQHANSIVLSASGSALNTTNTNSLFIDPIRSDPAVSDGFLHYNTATKEIVYNNVGGTSGGPINSSFNDLITSTGRGLAFTGVNLYGIETAKTVDYFTPFLNRGRTLVSTIAGTPGRWNSHSLSMSADGKYELIGVGNGSLPGDASSMYRSSNYGADWTAFVALGQSNWSGSCMSRDGSIQYIICGGINMIGGGVLKSEDFGRTFAVLPSSTALHQVWGPATGCSGDGRIVFACQLRQSGDAGPLYGYMSYDYGNSWAPLPYYIAYSSASMDITGRYIALGIVYGHDIGQKMLVSRDFGQSWENIIQFPQTDGIACVAVSANGKFMYAGSLRNLIAPFFQAVLYYSSDYGKTFSVATISGLAGGTILQTFELSCDDTGQYVTASVFASNPADGGIIYSSDYGQTYTTLFNIDNAICCVISRNAQYITFAPRFYLYRSFIPVYFPSGALAYGNESSTILTAINSNAGTVPAGGTSDVYNSILGLGAVSGGLSSRTWEIGMATNVGSGNNLGFLTYDTDNFTGTRTIRGIIVTGNSNVVMNFTGQHRCFPADDTMYPLTSNVGKIVIASGAYQAMPKNGALLRGVSSITIEESLPLVSLSRQAKDKRCFGVICDVEDFSSRITVNGNFTTIYPKIAGDTRIFVNSLGEGAIWVCDVGGPVENGDYLTTSDIPGYATRQSEPYIANYTVAKATASCDFVPRMLRKQIPQTMVLHGQTQYVLDQFSTVVWTYDESFEPQYVMRYIDEEGNEMTEAEYDARIAAGLTAHKAVFLGCTYHCG